MSVDAVGVEVWRHRFAGIAEEMGAILRRAAYSPNIKERADCSCALFSPAGELVAQAEHIPVHLGSMRASVDAALSAFPDLAEGDQVLLNDPFQGGTHLNDVTMVGPVFAGDRLLGFAASRAHHADLGGASPGSLSIDAVDALAEGLRVPPVRAVRGGRWDPDVRRMLVANSRMPEEREGDLDAQWGANLLAVRRLRELEDREGTGEVLRWAGQLLDYAERRMRAALPDLPGLVLEAEEEIEAADGSASAIRVRVRCEGGTVEADFGGTDPARHGLPNAVEAVTRSCLEFVIRCITDPEIPRNGGAVRPVRLHTPAGSLVAAGFPQPVGAGNVEASQRIVDALFRALAPAVPDRVGAASQGTMNNVLIGGLSASGPFVYYETIGGGQGGRPGGRGQSGIHTGMTNTRNTPVEALEWAYPLRVERYGLRRGTGGRGRFPGGDGIERAIRLETDGTVSLVGQRRRTRPWGLGGGGDGAPGEDVVVREGAEVPVSPMSTFEGRAGDLLVVRTPGGGGYGRAEGLDERPEGG